MHVVLCLFNLTLQEMISFINVHLAGQLLPNEHVSDLICTHTDKLLVMLASTSKHSILVIYLNFL